MSYSEKDGQVILTMLLLAQEVASTHWHGFDDEIRLLNRLNDGNPNFKPYQVEAKQKRA